MAYSTFNDVIVRYPPILTMIGSGDQEISSVDVSSMYIKDAEAIIDSFIGAKYQTPAQNTPLLTFLASDIAIWKMVQDKAPRAPELAERRWEDAMKMLADIRDGKMVLTGSQTLLSGGDNYVWSNQQSYHPVFSPVLNEVDQRVDRDQVRDEKDTRLDD